MARFCAGFASGLGATTIKVPPIGAPRFAAAAKLLMLNDVMAVVDVTNG